MAEICVEYIFTIQFFKKVSRFKQKFFTPKQKLERSPNTS